MRTYRPRAAAIPVRSAAPYPCCGAATIRAPAWAASSADASTLLLSTTITSPPTPSLAMPARALRTQAVMVAASLRQGSTTLIWQARCSNACARSRSRSDWKSAGSSRNINYPAWIGGDDLGVGRDRLQPQDRGLRAPSVAGRGQCVTSSQPASAARTTARERSDQNRSVCLQDHDGNEYVRRQTDRGARLLAVENTY